MFFKFYSKFIASILSQNRPLISKKSRHSTAMMLINSIKIINKQIIRQDKGTCFPPHILHAHRSSNVIHINKTNHAGWLLRNIKQRKLVIQSTRRKELRIRYVFLFILLSIGGNSISFLHKKKINKFFLEYDLMNRHEWLNKIKKNFLLCDMKFNARFVIFLLNIFLILELYGDLFLFFMDEWYIVLTKCFRPHTAIYLQAIKKTVCNCAINEISLLTWVFFFSFIYKADEGTKQLTASSISSVSFYISNEACHKNLLCRIVWKQKLKLWTVRPRNDQQLVISWRHWAMFVLTWSFFYFFNAGHIYNLQFRSWTTTDRPV